MGCTFGPVPVTVDNAPQFEGTGKTGSVRNPLQSSAEFTLPPLSDLEIKREGDRTGPYCNEDVTLSVLGLSSSCLEAAVHLRREAREGSSDMVLPAQRSQDGDATLFALTVPGPNSRIPAGPYTLGVEPTPAPEAGVNEEIEIGCGPALLGVEIVSRNRREVELSLTGAGFSKDLLRGLTLGGETVRAELVSDGEIHLFVPVQAIETGEVEVEIQTGSGPVTGSFDLDL